MIWNQCNIELFESHEYLSVFIQSLSISDQWEIYEVLSKTVKNRGEQRKGTRMIDDKGKDRTNTRVVYPERTREKFGDKFVGASRKRDWTTILKKFSSYRAFDCARFREAWREFWFFPPAFLFSCSASEKRKLLFGSFFSNVDKGEREMSC